MTGMGTSCGVLSRRADVPAQLWKFQNNVLYSSEEQFRQHSVNETENSSNENAPNVPVTQFPDVGFVLGPDPSSLARRFRRKGYTFHAPIVSRERSLSVVNGDLICEMDGESSFPCNTTDDALGNTCWICTEPLTVYSDVAVLDCGHFYDVSCLERLTPDTCKYDPLCPVCAYGENRVSRMPVKRVRKGLEKRSGSRRRGSTDTSMLGGVAERRRSVGASFSSVFMFPSRCRLFSKKK